MVGLVDVQVVDIVFGYIGNLVIGGDGQYGLFLLDEFGIYLDGDGCGEECIQFIGLWVDFGSGLNVDQIVDDGVFLCVVGIVFVCVDQCYIESGGMGVVYQC